MLKRNYKMVKNQLEVSIDKILKLGIFFRDGSRNTGTDSNHTGEKVRRKLCILE